MEGGQQGCGHRRNGDGGQSFLLLCWPVGLPESAVYNIRRLAGYKIGEQVPPGDGYYQEASGQAVKRLEKGENEQRERQKCVSGYGRTLRIVTFPLLFL